MLVDAFSRNIPKITNTPTIIFGAGISHPPRIENSSALIDAVRSV